MNVHSLSNALATALIEAPLSIQRSLLVEPDLPAIPHDITALIAQATTRICRVRESANLIPADALTKDHPPNRQYLIAVSGGRDSVALLHQMVRLGFRKLVVCHLNHQLRGRSSDADARFVNKLAKKY